MNIETTARIGRGFNCKRQKVSDDEGEVVVAHLKISGAVVTREQMDWLLSQAQGWCAGSLFDDAGVPWIRADLSLRTAEFTARGALSAPASDPRHAGGPRLNVTQGTLSGITLSLIVLGAELSGELSWTAAGDELDDVAPMLGAMVDCKLALSNAGQADWVEEQRRRSQQAAEKLHDLVDKDGVTANLITPEGEKIPFGRRARPLNDTQP